MRTRTGTKGEVQSQRLKNDRSVLGHSGYVCALVLSLGLLWSQPLLQPEPPPRRRAGCALHLGSCHACSQLLSFINASSARSFTISLTVLSFSAPVRSQTLVALLKFFGISAGVLSRVFSTRSRLATMFFHKQHETNNYLVMIILR